jgi:hypothetical protein
LLFPGIVGIREDFNFDNTPDAAIVGKFNNPGDLNDQTFVASLAKQKGDWAVNYFSSP